MINGPFAGDHYGCRRIQRMGVLIPLPVRQRIRRLFDEILRLATKPWLAFGQGLNTMRENVIFAQEALAPLTDEEMFFQWRYQILRQPT